MVRLRLNLPKIAATKAVVALFCGVLAAGVWVKWDLGLALIAAGVMGVAYGLLLVDVDQPKRGAK